MEDPDVMDIFAAMRFGVTTQVVKHLASRKTGYSNDTSHIVEILDQRFATQDLDDLTELDFIKCDNPYSDGGKTYRLTRSGQNFLKALRQN